jgi:tetrapyrrole methylase family protein/MazG family protein
LSRANDKFVRRFETIERRLHERGSSVHESTLETLEAEWARAKEKP